VVTHVAPIPAAIPSSAEIGPAGGSVRSSDGRVTLKIPAGALVSPVTVSIAPATNTAPNAIGPAYTISPPGSTFEGLAQAVLSYTNADLEGTSSGGLGIATEEGSSWFGITGGSLDPVARTLTVPIPSTSPSPTSANRRATQRADANSTLGPYGSAMLSPARAAVVVGKTKALKVVVVGPPSTRRRTPGGVVLLQPLTPQNVLVGWYVNGVQFGNSAVGFLSAVPGPGAPDGLYGAPNCPPSQNPVRVEARVLVETFLATAQAVIRVVEKDWMIEVTYRSQSLCSLGFIWSLDYTRSHNGAFSLDDQARVFDYLAGLNRNQTTTPNWCPGFDPQGCSQLTLTGSPIGDLTLGDVDGRLIESLQDLAFDLTITAQIPGTGAYVTFTCPGHEPFLYLIPHATPPTVVQQLLVHPGANRTFQTTLDIVYPGWTESAIVKITPIKPAGCP
jgi:hypothetical protein